MVNTPEEMLTGLAGEYDAYRLLATLASSMIKKRRTLAALEHTYRECVRAMKGTRAAGLGDEATEWRKVQEFAQAQRDEMRLWIALRQQRFHVAWDALVTAQYAAHWAARWLPEIEPAQHMEQHLAEVERTVFPKQQFLSPALIVDESQVECSLCHIFGGECEHIPGEIYAGEVAGRNLHRIVGIREISFVDNPANKRARAFRYDNMDLLTLDTIRAPEAKRPSAQERPARFGAARLRYAERRRFDP
jgi:hypothetical protein